MNTPVYMPLLMVPQLVQVGAVSTAEIGVVLALLFKSPTSTSSVDEEFRSHSYPVLEFSSFSSMITRV